MALSTNTKEIEIDANIIYEEGEKLYNTNSTFQSLANIMEDKEFRTFFDKYSKSEMDWKTIGMFMHLYQYIEQNCSYDDQKKLNKYQKIYLLNKWIKDSNTRPEIVQQYLQINKSEKKKKSIKKIEHNIN